MRSSPRVRTSTAPTSGCSCRFTEPRSASTPVTPREAPARPCARWRPTPLQSSAAIWTCFGGCSGLKTEVQPHADIVDAGILAAEQLRVAHVDPARLDAGAAGEANPDAEFGLEQDSAAEVDLVVGQILKLLSRTVVDGDSDPGADVNSIAELRRQTDRRIARVSSGIQGAEHVGLKRRMADPAATITELKVGAVFNAALVQRSLDVVGVDAAKHFPGMRGSERDRGEKGEAAGAADHGRINARRRHWCRVSRRSASWRCLRWATATSKC